MENGLGCGSHIERWSLGMRGRFDRICDKMIIGVGADIIKETDKRLRFCFQRSKSRLSAENGPFHTYLFGQRINTPRKAGGLLEGIGNYLLKATNEGGEHCSDRVLRNLEFMFDYMKDGLLWMRKRSGDDGFMVEDLRDNPIGLDIFPLHLLGNVRDAYKADTEEDYVLMGGNLLYDTLDSSLTKVLNKEKILI